jgi:hypothetical protein
VTAPIPHPEAVQTLEFALRQNRNTQKVIDRAMKRLTQTFDNESREVTNALKSLADRVLVDLPTHERKRLAAAIAQDTVRTVIATKLTER